MSCPWAKIEKPEPINLEEIISEEVARELQAKEEKKFKSQIEGTGNFIITKESEDLPLNDLSLTSNGTENDEMIARTLQMQWDKEYDEHLKRTEEKFNGASKVSISFENYRRCPLVDCSSDSEKEEIVDIRDRKDWDRFDAVKREFDSIPQCGYKIKSDGKMVTKHDGVMSGRKNACKLLSFPPEFQTGDGENFDLKLSNKVFNSLKMHSKHEQARRRKFHDKKEDQATATFGFDQPTRLILLKMINNQLLSEINGVISIGKEAVILHANFDPLFPFDSKDCVIKVFKTTLCEYKQRDQYISNDHRFKDRIGKQTAKKTVHIWAEKEMANLMRLEKAGIPCPRVVKLKKHVLVMSFIGENGRAAPKLKDTLMQPADYIIAYDQVVQGMKKLFDEANLIHGDLSEYNILWHEDQCYFIDVSQAVEQCDESAFSLLHRDCRNVTNFFTKKGVPEVLSPEDLFKSISGCDFSEQIALSKMKESFKVKPHLLDKPGIEFKYNFDTAWEQSQLGVIPPVHSVTQELDLNVNKVIQEDTILVESPKA
ncbi:serine/threonine-protein kinase RIO3-like [Diorhabda carinulata]|uniref:serine/threonine-protein kinase RIO3-like n=1 Tax=Diorhabda carinulata TaxID=1163345 RepID=UPI0025A29C83|nr:serine/threonine-protein kinase RIO3-like [Diorhabda carinulata]